MSKLFPLFGDGLKHNIRSIDDFFFLHSYLHKLFKVIWADLFHFKR